MSGEAPSHIRSYLPKGPCHSSLILVNLGLGTIAKCCGVVSVCNSRSCQLSAYCSTVSMKSCAFECSAAVRSL